MSGSDAVSVAPAAVVPKLSAPADSKGRLRTSKEQRCVILAEFERSEISAAAFAQRTGLKYSTFDLCRLGAALPPNQTSGPKISATPA